MHDSVRRSLMLSMLVCTVVGGQSVHWLMTPAAHPGASSVRAFEAWLQLVLATVVWLYAARSIRRISASERT